MIDVVCVGAAEGCDVTTLSFKGWTPLKMLVIRTEGLPLKKVVVLKRLICLEE